MQMHGRQRRTAYEVCPVVSDTCYAHILGNASARSLERTDRTVCDNIRRTDDAVEVGALLQKFLHAQKPALRIEVRRPPRHVVHGQSGALQRLQKTFPSRKSCRQVIFTDADIGDPASALRDHSLREFPHTASVIVIDAVKAAVLLPGDHKRDRAVLQ